MKYFVSKSVISSGTKLIPDVVECNKSEFPSEYTRLSGRKMFKILAFPVHLTLCILTTRSELQHSHEIIFIPDKANTQTIRSCGGMICWLKLSLHNFLHEFQTFVIFIWL